jgi:hypothetical protein
MESVEEVGRVRSRATYIHQSFVPTHKYEEAAESLLEYTGPKQAFFRTFTLAEWVMAVLCVVIAVTGVAGVFIAIEGPPKGLVDAAERHGLAPGAGRNHAALQAGKPAVDARGLFNPEDRAWLEIGHIDEVIASPDQPSSRHFQYGIYPRNVGKSVANDVLVLALEATDGASFMSNRQSIKAHQDQLFFASGANKPSQGQPGTVSLAPGEQAVVGGFAGGAEPKRLADGFVVYSYILGRIDYIDVFGIPHWTHFCFYVLNAKGELGSCAYGNDKDNFS